MTAKTIELTNNTPLNVIYIKSSLESIEIPSLITISLVLISICILSTNNYFSYHAPSAIAKQYEDYYQLNTSQFGSLYTIYSFPNIILVFFSGLLIDKYGLRLTSILFNVIILVGMTICAMTPAPSDNINQFHCYLVLLFGRLLLGLGGESIAASGFAMISKWFTTSGYLNFAMSINQAFVQLFGSSLAFYLLPRLHSIVKSQWVTVLVCLLSLVSNIYYNYNDYRYTNYLTSINNNNEYDNIDISNELNTIETVNSKNYSTINHNDSLKISNKKRSLISYIRNELNKFSYLFWLVILNISLVSPILYTFTAFGPLYLQENFQSTRTAEAAGDATSILYLAIIAAPLTGMIIDHVGYRSQIQCIACISIPLVFLLLTYEILLPWKCMLWLGLLYSITESNGLAIISVIVPTELHGTAFGISGCCISFALLIEPATVGYLHQLTGSFTASIWIFILLTFLSGLIGLLVVIHDSKHHKLISTSGNN